MSRECEGIRELLSSWHDGELAAADEARVRDHLATCVACRETLASYASLDVALGEEEVLRSEEEWERLAQRVDAAVAAEPPPGAPAPAPARERRGRWRRWMYAPAAGTVAAALLIALFHPLLRELDTGSPGPESLPPRVPPAPPSTTVIERDKPPGTLEEKEATPVMPPPQTEEAPEPVEADEPTGTPDAAAAKPQTLVDQKPPGTRGEEAVRIVIDEEKAEELAEKGRYRRMLSAEPSADAGDAAKKTIGFEPVSEAPVAEPEIFFGAEEVREARAQSSEIRISDATSRSARHPEAWRAWLAAESERVGAGDDADAIVALARSADDFVAAYPGDHRVQEVQDLRVTLWARLAGLDPERFCATARERADEWSATPGAGSASPDTREAVRVLRERTCP